MNLIPLTCPNCGANLKIEEDRDFCFCSYCGSKILLDDNTITIQNRIIDEAKIRRVEQDRKRFESQERAEQERQQAKQTWKKILIGWLIGLAVLFVPLERNRGFETNF